MAEEILAAGFKEQPFWWEAAPVAARLPGELPKHVDVAVIGAGYSGLSAALTLARAGRSVLVLEAGIPGDGASSKNGGMCGDQLKPSLEELTRHYGETLATALLKEAREALEFLADFIKQEGIECHFSRMGRFTGALKAGQYESMARASETLRKVNGFAFDMVTKGEVRQEIGTDAYVGGRVTHHHGGLHPALYHRELLKRVLAAGAQVAGETPMTGLRREMRGFTVATPRGEVEARDVVVTTNGYTGRVTEWLRRRVIPVTSYMIATEELSDNLMRQLMPKGRMLTDTNRLLVYFRPSHDGKRILFGGRAHYRPTDLKDAGAVLRRYMIRLFPELSETRLSHCWYGFIAYSFDRLPHTGVVDGAHYALGYCGSGVVMATWLGRKAALSVLGSLEGKSAFAEIRHPTIPLYRGTPWFLPLVKAYYYAADMVGR
ncbi:MAG: NAD(P)/FAD-dependent oxidoreductase [Alphaproteobacteria bacterium]